MTAQRARIILRCADGLASAEVAKELRITNQTVCKWRSRYIEQGPARLLDEPRCGAPRTVSDRKVEEVVTATLEEMPRDATHWSTRSMAKRLRVLPDSLGLDAQAAPSHGSPGSGAYRRTWRDGRAGLHFHRWPEPWQIRGALLQ